MTDQKEKAAQARFDAAMLRAISDSISAPVGQYSQRQCVELLADMAEFVEGYAALPQPTGEPVGWSGSGDYEPTEAMVDAGLYTNHRSNSQANLIKSFKAMMQQAELDGLVSIATPADALTRATRAEAERDAAIAQADRAEVFVQSLKGVCDSFCDCDGDTVAGQVTIRIDEFFAPTPDTAKGEA